MQEAPLRRGKAAILVVQLELPIEQAGELFRKEYESIRIRFVS